MPLTLQSSGFPQADVMSKSCALRWQIFQRLDHSPEKVNVKYWTLTNGCIIRSSDCQSLNVRDMGLPL